MRRFAAAISEHPVAAHAVGEVAGDLMEHVGEGVDLLCVFVTAPFAGALEDIAAAMRTLLDPKVMIGCAASSVIGNGVEIEGDPAIVAWAGNVGTVAPLRLEVVDAPTGGRAVAGWPIDLPWVPAASVLLADPFSFPVEAVFARLNEAGGFPRVVGGMASAGKGPGGNRLVLDGKVYDDGGVGVLIDASDDITVQTVVSQGCRAIGSPMVVTRAERNVIYELAGEPALQRLTAMVKSDLSDEDVALAAEGLLVGRVIDEHRETFGAGDFVIRTLLDADPLEGSLTVGELIEVGTTVQFHLRDAEAADAELRQLLLGQRADASLLFSCNGRGTNLFEEPDHDAGVVADLLNDPPTAGFLAAGEFGPLAGRNLVHGFTAAMALFSRRD